MDQTMNAVNFDSSVCAREQVVLPHLLEGFCDRSPDRTFTVFEDGSNWSYLQLRARTRSAATAMKLHGLEAQDKLIVWLPNSPLGLRCFFAAAYCAAVYVGINTAYRGGLLEHVLETSDARMMVAHPDLIDRLLEVHRRGNLKTVFTSADKVRSHGERFAEAGLRLLSIDLFDEGDSGFELPDLQPWDMQSICFTSGTTGPSKGVLSSYMHLFTMGIEATPGVHMEDRHMVNLPLFHAGGTLAVYGALARGASIVLLDGFQTDTFLDICRRTGATVTILLGAMTGFLMKRAPSSEDRRHGLRQALVLPLGDEAQQFSTRFGIEVFTTFNMSEISCPIRSERNPTLRGSCGRVRQGVQVRIVDANDQEVPTGAVGELIVRADTPWTMFSEYYKMPEATVKAWRNGWFHTGDAFKVDASGNYFFVDRLKDSIRRRGENISSFELECEVMTFPGLLEVAAVGVPSADSEDEVLMAIVLQRGKPFEPGALIGYLQGRLPHFMVPRYVRVLEELPKTPTSKVEKHVIRRDGVTPDTWDREAAGIRIQRERLQ